MRGRREVRSPQSVVRFSVLSCQLTGGFPISVSGRWFRGVEIRFRAFRQGIYCTIFSAVPSALECRMIGPPGVVLSERASPLLALSLRARPYPRLLSVIAARLMNVINTDVGPPKL